MSELTQTIIASSFGSTINRADGTTMMTQMEARRDVRKLQSRDRNGRLMYPAPVAFTWVKLPGMPWMLLSIDDAQLTAEQH